MWDLNRIALPPQRACRHDVAKTKTRHLETKRLGFLVLQILKTEMGEIMIGKISLAFALATMLLLSSQPHSTSAALPDYDLIIRNGRVIDGSGRPGFNADVAILGDRIVRIGNLRGARSRKLLSSSHRWRSPRSVDA